MMEEERRDCVQDQGSGTDAMHCPHCGKQLNVVAVKVTGIKISVSNMIVLIVTFFFAMIALIALITLGVPFLLVLFREITSWL